MDDLEAVFKMQFIASFLAAWCANNYDDYCARGWTGKMDHPPVEDATYLADQAWKEMKKKGTRRR